MAEAMISGVIAVGVASPDDIKVGEPMEGRREHLKQKYHIRPLAENSDVVDGADVVVLAVKPQQALTAMTDLGAALTAEQTVLSIVAGFKVAALMEGLGHAAVVRVMPNTPAQIGAGMSVWTATPEVSKAGLEAAGTILRSLGEEVYVPDEKLIEMATALSGCGPAYVFLFIEALIDAGVYLGMTREMSRKLTLQTVLGSTRLVSETGRHPAELKDMVTSPAGATIEAVLAFEQSGFRASVLDAVIAAYEKTNALGDQK